MEQIDVLETNCMLQLPDQTFARVELASSLIPSGSTGDPRLLISMGVDVWIEMELEESLRFCHERIFHLKMMLEAIEDRHSHIQSHIDMFNLVQQCMSDLVE